jgi:hypothetical protein
MWNVAIEAATPRRRNPCGGDGRDECEGCDGRGGREGRAGNQPARRATTTAVTERTTIPRSTSRKAISA